MRIIETGAFDELRKMELNRPERKPGKAIDAEKASADSESVSEDTQKLSQLLGDRSFSIDQEKVSRIKQQLERGEYQHDSKQIAKQLVSDEQLGIANLGILSP